MGRGTGRHAYSNAFGAVDEEIGDADRQDHRLLFRLVKVGAEVRDVLVEVCQKGLLGDLLQTGLGVTHGRRPVALDISEIPVAVDQGDPFFKFLGHHDQGVINRAVTVGVVFTHCIADDTGTLPVGSVRPDAQLVHVIESAPLNRL